MAVFSFQLESVVVYDGEQKGENLLFINAPARDHEKQVPLAL